MNFHNILDYKEGKLFWKNTEIRADYLSRHGNFYVRLPNKSTKPCSKIVWAMFNRETSRRLEHLNGDITDYSIENLVQKGTDCVNSEYIRSRFFYDGTLRFISTKQPVGAISKEGYLRFSVAGRIFSVHQLVWLYFNDSLPEMIDHIDGDKLNNCIENLRECSVEENRWNVARRSGKTLPKGVYKGKSGGFQVRITHRSVCKSYGTFDSLEEATSVAEETYKKLHGRFHRQSDV